MNRLLLGLTARVSRYNEDTRRFYDNESYFQYVSSSGHIPVLLGSVNERDADILAEKLDGLIITGGEDMDPAYYGAGNTASELTDHDIDESDLLLYHAFLKKKKPVLGICRGIQVINVAEGGTLYQDIPSEKENTVPHQQRSMVPPRGTGEYAHDCTFVEGSILYGIFGKTHPVNSYHHQAVKNVAPSLHISAVAEDGIIEGLEKDGVLAIQWHPERLMQDPCHLAIMAKFTELCLSAKQSHEILKNI